MSVSRTKETMMKTKKLTKTEIKAMADEVRMMTADQVAALPNLLGVIASIQCKHNGFYTYNETETGKKIFIELVA